MTPHRPDLISLFAGLLFLVIGLTALLTGRAPDPGMAVGTIGILGGLTVVARLVGRARPAPTVTVPNQLHDPLDIRRELDDDPVFGPPIDPETLDRAFRERFGDDDPVVANRPEDAPPER